ncbi:hypothetical protein B0H14DRAFT_3490040 [Mycena olivaceomarginata]|nr:hypothetical protein B0H14DRAFT_3490040 [Mycena olivaceomarginata]
MSDHSLPDEIISEILSPALKVPDEAFCDTSNVSPFSNYSESTSAYLLVCKSWLQVYISPGKLPALTTLRALEHLEVDKCQLHWDDGPLNLVLISPESRLVLRSLKIVGNIHRLELHGNTALLDQFPSRALHRRPELCTVFTKIQLLPFLVASIAIPSLIELSLSYCSHDELITGFLRALLDVSVEPCFCEATALSPILEFFLRLTRFEVEFSLTPGDFFASLSNLSALPAKLQFLAFHWVFDYQYEEEDVDLTYNEGPSVPRGVRQGLVRRCAALRAVWLEGSYFMYSWQHGHGTEKDKENDVDEMREEYEDFRAHFKLAGTK